ncbi:MAG: S1 RNA-binding domain-containing protein [Candidatus Omnitrophota bacterium]
MEDTPQAQAGFKTGDTVDIEITKITNFGAFAKLPFNKIGLIHISQIREGFVKDINDHLKIGDKVKARIVAINGEGRIDLSLKKEVPVSVVGPRQNQNQFRNQAFEEKLKRFLKKSESLQTDLKHRTESKIDKK